MIRAVLDTNVFVSGLISSKGNSAKILDYWRERKFRLVTSAKIVKEFEKVISYPRILKKRNIRKAEIQSLVKNLKTFSRIVSKKQTILVIKDDPDDDKFVEAGVAGGANFIVSGDRHLLDLGEYRGIKIITPREFVKMLEIGSK